MIRRLSLVALLPSLLSAAHARPEVAAVPAACDVRMIVAHRGSSADRPENTLAAYRRAIEAGAGTIEVDLRLTKDGQLVSLHDSRVDRTTNGSGPLSALTLAEAQVLDAGGRFDERYRGERIPTFQQILAVARGHVDVLLDLKGEGPEYLGQITSEVRRFGEPHRIIAGVRSAAQADYFRRSLPEARQIGLIPTPADIEAFVQSGVKVIRLWPAWLSDRMLAERVVRAGAEILLSADQGSREECARVLSVRPRYLFTNDPARLGRTLKELCGSH